MLSNQSLSSFVRTFREGIRSSFSSWGPMLMLPFCWLQSWWMAIIGVLYLFRRGSWGVDGEVLVSIWEKLSFQILLQTLLTIRALPSGVPNAMAYQTPKIIPHCQNPILFATCYNTLLFKGTVAMLLILFSLLSPLFFPFSFSQTISSLLFFSPLFSLSNISPLSHKSLLSLVLLSPVLFFFSVEISVFCGGGIEIDGCWGGGLCYGYLWLRSGIIGGWVCFCSSDWWLWVKMAVKAKARRQSHH